MKLPRYAPDPAALVEFYTDGLQALEAVVERTWHDQLEILAEGPAARLWKPDGTLHQAVLRFPATDSASGRDATSDVFPGCPLTFQLAELLNASPPPLHRVVLAADALSARPPSPEVALKTWTRSWPDTSRWAATSAFAASHHFSVLALVRCEIQAIDQHWSLHRVAFSVRGGAPDHELAAAPFLTADPEAATPIAWPDPEPAAWQDALERALREELASDLEAVRSRQEKYLRRELERIDDYFESYGRELSGRKPRQGADPEAARKNLEDRRAASRAEHVRRRDDQVQRHGIRVLPQIDALLCVAEPAWSVRVNFVQDRTPATVQAWFVPRSRRWFREDA